MGNMIDFSPDVPSRRRWCGRQHAGATGADACVAGARRMDPGFLSELAALLPHHRCVTLPQVFVGGRHLDGAEEVCLLHESGELRRIVAAPMAAPTTCARCGGEPYVLCGSCDGSHKQYSHKGGGGFRTCASCNENGLVRCPECCFSVA